LLFDTGHWDEAMAEVQALSLDLKEPMAACCDLGVAAAICFHRGDQATARRHLAAAAPHAQRTGAQVISPLAIARSLDREHADSPAQALAVLTAEFAGNAEVVDELESLLADAVRLATTTGDLGIAEALTAQATDLATGSRIPHRKANALYCGGLLGNDSARLLAAAQRYTDAGRPLQTAKALEAAAGYLIGSGDPAQARPPITRAAEIYTSLGAAADLARLEARYAATKVEP
jgi:hypothetical protein